jgi:hypothetical protein
MQQKQADHILQRAELDAPSNGDFPDHRVLGISDWQNLKKELYCRFPLQVPEYRWCMKDTGVLQFQHVNKLCDRATLALDLGYQKVDDLHITLHARTTRRRHCN